MTSSYLSEIPVLNLTLGLEAQESFHRKPADPSIERGSGPDRLMFSKSLQPPESFGELSTISDTPQVSGFGDQDTVELVFCRSEVSEVTRKHGLDRADNDAYERAQFHPLRHPEFNGIFNFEGRRPNELTDVEKRLLDINVNYPDIPKGILRAPFVFRKKQLALPIAKQPSAFSQVFGTPEIFERIVKPLLPRYEDLNNLCQASQFTAGMVQSLFMRIDTTEPDFLGWDFETREEVREEEKKDYDEIVARRIEKRRKGMECTAADFREPRARFFSRTIMISPIRPDEQGKPQEPILSKAGYPVTPSVEPHEEMSFSKSMRAHYKLLHMVHLNGKHIQHLILHGLPWLNSNAVECILRELPILETLGIHQCFLMPFSETKPLLKAVNEINLERLGRDKPHVKVDFTPYYYKGSRYKEDGSGHVGEYGLIAEEVPTLDTNRAVVANLMNIWRLCKEGKQDFFTPGTGFRAFLDRLPLRLHTLSDILHAIAAISDFHGKKYHGGAIEGSGPDTEFEYTAEGEVLVSQPVHRAMEITLWQDLIVACRGVPMDLRQLRKWLLKNDEISFTVCVGCQEHLPAYFFEDDAPDDGAQCHGCKLVQAMIGQEWRMFRERSEIATSMFLDSHGIFPIRLARVMSNVDTRSLRSVEQIREALREAFFGRRHRATNERNERSERNGRNGRNRVVIRRPIARRRGSSDPKYLGAAHNLWCQYSREFPRKLSKTRRAMARIDEDDPVMMTEEKFDSRKRKRDAMSDEVEKMERGMGTIQRDYKDDSVKRQCRTWEVNIRDYRADLLLQRGGEFSYQDLGVSDGSQNDDRSLVLGADGAWPGFWNDEEDNEVQREEQDK